LAAARVELAATAERTADAARVAIRGIIGGTSSAPLSSSSLRPPMLPPWLTLPAADRINQPHYAIATRACSNRSSLITTKS
jgi:hypothetical protein